MKRKSLTLAAAFLLIGTFGVDAQSTGNIVKRNRAAGNLTYSAGTLDAAADVVTTTTTEAYLSSGNLNEFNATGNLITPDLQSPHRPNPNGSDPVTISVTNMNNNSVVLEADVMINVRATSYTAIFSATETGPTLASTDSLMNVRLEEFIAGIQKEGVEREDIHVDFISMIPVYDVELVSRKFSNNADEVQSGFQMKKNIHVNFTDHRALDRIITHASQADIYDVVKVDYNVENSEAAYDTLRTEAARVIENKRLIYDRMGLETKVMSLAYGAGVSYPIERYDGYVAYHQAQSVGDAVKDNPNLNIRPKEKTETIFYNKIAYNQFDLVINADAGEPMVQFYYKLKVRYSVQVKPEVVEPQLLGDNTTTIITP